MLVDVGPVQGLR